MMNRKRINPAVWNPVHRTDTPLADMHPYEVRVTLAGCVVTTKHWTAEDAAQERAFQMRLGRTARVVDIRQEA